MADFDRCSTNGCLAIDREVGIGTVVVVAEILRQLRGGGERPHQEAQSAIANALHSLRALEGQEGDIL